ncbi:Acyl-CoA synthetase (AMP-forming)/AMP-acid ligase II [Hyella patelloides LEGE 07179]|uniref:Acyl-CoA synthetase (AMP-forming)/AMP-acid ligase II n=1 Tax=Hyella patelloides LEGE 07179 TaxID=945734 RepID=A0A563W151_9CYAN|nr:fatty acyl-AMP ligase [Hyella patelloides]VEP17434.1 Acyl-CoA synthetase (AMP-forming)/AMP-acid ligase II [Hyella patelloides LEGE 07179]
MSGLEKKIPANTLVDVLRQRAALQPDKVAYTFLVDGESEKINLTYLQLEQKAQAIATYIQSLCQPQARVLLLYPPGLGFIEAFFGCLYGGAIAIPAYPPRPNRSIDRIQSIIKSAEPALALTTNSIITNLQKKADRIPELKTLRWLATDNLELKYAQKWQETAIYQDDLAFLQYTSGSTAEPKGVKISHHNLLHNLEAIHSCFQHHSQSQGVIWLPPYHDMGLIGGILQPLYGDFPVTLMSPLMFLQNPLRWLKAISHYKATTSGGPNFAYDLCVQKFKPESFTDLDLSSWDVAFNGAEPINYETIEKFTKTFAPYGFRESAFYPCYGMAEATLIISGGVKQSKPLTKIVDSKQLEQNKIAISETETPNTRILVSCGHSLPDQTVTIINSDTMQPCKPGEIGEIWVSGSSIAHGYWNQPQATEKTFKAQIKNRESAHFLRTGDLGFIQQGELFVTGRLKDLIIIKGRNHYPQDIERTVEASSDFIRPGGTASFVVDGTGEEKLVILSEIERRYWDRRNKSQSNKASTNNLEKPDLKQLIRRQIAQNHDLQTHRILLLKPGSIPKTSSGKIQRHVCRNSFLSGDFQSLEVVNS